MKPFLLPTLLMTFSTFTMAEAVPAASWAHESSDLKADASVRWGQLDNGLRYAILPNAEPPDRVSLRLYVDAGSLMEEDDQQGLAHFLEHMAFNGTKHFPPGEMIEFFQRLGMAFGADTNAHTSFNETVYKLELPKPDKEMLDQGLLLFHDYIGSMLLNAKEVDKERGIILSEKLSRDSVSYRMMVEGYKFSLPDAKLSKRLPIGEEEVIKTAPQQRFVDFYKKWYTADRMTLVAVGAVDADEMEARIRQQFSDLPAPTEKQPNPDLGKISEGRGVVAKLHTENELQYVSISIDTIRPSDKKPDTVAKRNEQLTRRIADAIVSRRFEILAKQENAPILNADIGSYDYLNFLYSSSIEANCQPDKWKEALGLLEQEIRRAAEHGFTEAEFAEAKANILNNAEKEAEQASTRKSINLANQLVSSIAANEVFTDPKADFELTKAALEEITVEASHAAFRSDWATDDINIFLGGKLEIPNAGETIVNLWKDSRKQPVEPPAQKDAVSFAYTEFGTPGTIAGRKEIEDLKITQVTFANNVHLNIKPTDFDKNTIQILVNVGGGRLDAVKGDEALLGYADATFIAGGLENHSDDDLNRILAGKTVSRGFSVSDDAFSLGGSTVPKDLELQLQVLCAYLTAPGYRPEADRQFKNGLDALYGQVDHTLEGVIQAKLPRYLRSGDARFGLSDRKDVEAATPERLKAFLAKPLAEGYLEINIVGDIDPESAIAAVAKTFGALPSRQKEKPAYTAERNLTWPKDKEIKLDYSTKVPKGVAAITWPTTDMWDIKRTRRLAILGDILDDRLRLKIREELGESYSPFAYHVPSETFTGFGFMTGMVILSPEQMDSVKAALKTIQKDLLEKGITDDEVSRVIQPQLTALKQQQRDNRYWLSSVLRGSQAHPEKFDWARALLEDVASIKKEEITPLIKEYLAEGRELIISVSPQPLAETAEPK